jgi:hypothetical protein
MSLPAAYFSKKLTEPLPIKGGPVLRTVGEAANYVLALPLERAEYCNRWRHAAQLLLDRADVAAVSHQVHLALFYDAQAAAAGSIAVISAKCSSTKARSHTLRRINRNDGHSVRSV